MTKKNKGRYYDIRGKKYGKLTVLDFSHRGKYGKIYWNCICKCGDTKTIIGEALRSGNTRSCGCLHSYKDNTAAFNHLYCNYKGRAKRSNLIFKLSKKLFKILTQQNCYYCGIKPSQILKPSKYSIEYVYNGLDRIDNNKGYIKNNLRSCCKMCNNMKHMNNENDFLNKITKIYKFMRINRPEHDDRYKDGKD